MKISPSKVSKPSADSVSSTRLTGRPGKLAVLPVLILIFCGTSAPLSAQETPAAQTQKPGPEAAQTPSLATIAGTVRDIQGEPVAGASVSVVGQEIDFSRVVLTDSKGAFAVGDLVPGNYKVTIVTEGGSNRPVLVDVALEAGERRELPVIGARVASSSTIVDVSAKPSEIAAAQLKQQESQRLLGIVPNFYSSYIWNAAPMNSKQKFMLTFRSNTDPFSFLLVATLASLEQSHNTFPGYGQGAEGYAKRFGAAYADTMISKMMSRAVLPSVFHQDPRYFYRGSGSLRTRIIYSLTSSVICRGDNGRLQPNYSQVLGSFAATGLANLYRAPGDRTVSLTFRNGLVMTASAAAQNLIREFLSRKLTPNVPAFANGKP